uniref:Glycosyltransferase family 92 protein n=1 Tax=Panagrellus redivivus TaxID=6233 RepID=A0A7E4W0V8_PANRE
MFRLARRCMAAIKRFKGTSSLVFGLVVFIVVANTYGWVPVKREAVSFEVVSNELKNSSVIVYRAYWEQLDSGSARIRILASSKCKSIENLEVRLGNKDADPVKIQIKPIENACPWTYAPLCEWNSFRIDAEIGLGALRDIAYLSKPSSNPIPIKIHKSLPKQSGLAVCVPPMFWLNDPLKLALFVETWKIRAGASHFYFYVHSVSKAVKTALDHYVADKTATVIPWPALPNTSTIDPNASQYRFGHSIAHNDCRLRVAYRFVALVDIDEFLLLNDHKNNTQTTLDYVNNLMKSHPLAGSFTFTHKGLHFPSWPEDGTVLRRVDYQFLEESMISNTTGPTKTIFIADRADVINTHYIVNHFGIYSTVYVSNKKAQLFHYRVNWMNETAENTTSIPIFDGIRPTVETNLQRVFTEVEPKIGKPLIVNGTVAETVNECLHEWKKFGCKTPTHMCRKKVAPMDDWVFSGGSSETYTIV